LLKAFQDDFRPTQTEHSRKLTLKKQKKEEKELEELQEKKAKELLQKQYHQEKKGKILELLSSLKEEETETLKSDFIEELLAVEVMKTLYNTKGFENIIIQGRWYDFLTSRFLASEYQNIENYERSKSESLNIAN